MKAVIMAGGSGTRLRPLTCNLPKPMVPIANRPMAYHIVNLLKKHGFNDIIFTLFYLPDAIKDYFQDGSDLGVNIDYAMEEGKPLGTAGCVKAVQDKLDDTFLVISGDSLTDMDLTKALKFHKERGSKATLVLKRVESPFEYGLVITDGEGRIQRFLEKPSPSEVFSDTANTGTYILEPEVLNYIVMGQEQDFSNDLFPLLLLRNEPMYGYTIDDDYWCDVGNLQMYRQAHLDLLDGKMDINLDYLSETEPGNGIWVGKDTQIDQKAKLTGPLIIGDGCHIGPDAELGKYTCIGDDAVIQDKVSLKQPVVWSNVYVGNQSKLRACVICNNATIHDGAEILEGGIIGNNCAVGQDAVVSPDVRVWPDKVIESGSKLLTSLVWGTKAPRTLFGAHGVRGLANVEISPEFAVNLAAAYGACIRSGPVLLSRDYWTVSQMISRSLSAGLVSVGIEVANLEATPLPVARHYVKSQRAAGLIHVRVSQRNPEKVMIEFFDSQGISITKRLERKIETTFFKEDFPRAKPSEVGHITYPSRVREYYKQSYVENIKGQVFEEDMVPFCVMPGSNFTRVMHSGEIATRAPKVVIDYAMAETDVILPDMLGQLGIETVVLNSSIRANPTKAEERTQMRRQLADVVKALNADMGAQIGRNGEQMTLVDETGQIIRGELLLALVADIILRNKPGKTIVVPVNASSIIEKIAHSHSCKVVRCKASETEIGTACAKEENVALGGSSTGCFVFPEFQNGYDGMFAVGQVLEHLTYQGRSLSEAVKDLPPLIYQVDTVHCPWERKGQVMRLLVEKHQDKEVELLDGVKIATSPDHWVLVLPDAVDPVVHLYADGKDLQKTSADLSEYSQLVKHFQQ